MTNEQTQAVAELREAIHPANASITRHPRQLLLDEKLDALLEVFQSALEQAQRERDEAVGKVNRLSSAVKHLIDQHPQRSDVPIPELQYLYDALQSLR